MALRVLAFVMLALSTAAAAPKKRWETLPLPPAMPAATTSGQVDVNGASIYYAIYGKADAARPPVVLLHGGLGNSDHFGFQMPALVDKFQVIVIDSRGQGRSTLTKAKLSYHAMAGDVVAVLDKLEVKKAAFVGWSDGGAIALDLAIHNPDRVAKLFIVGTNYDSKGSKPRGGSSTPTFKLYSAKCKADHQKLSSKPKSYNEVIDALLPVWRNPAGFTKAQLKQIQAPSMITLGAYDEIILTDQIKEMGTLIPKGQSLIFKDASHFVMWQDPESFNKALVEFLK
ncbi:MAG: alpha/beta hydrolase [Deltaproteobacteria bacterium]|nr:alpha/beta hydrolase [Deltaproteobacteria bacterium]